MRIPLSLRHVFRTDKDTRAAAQFARAVGAEVIFTPSSDAKIAQLKEMGYSKVINYKTHPEWNTEVLKLVRLLLFPLRRSSSWVWELNLFPRRTVVVCSTLSRTAEWVPSRGASGPARWVAGPT